MATLPMDYETRANRFLGAMACVENMLGNTVPGAVLDPEGMAYLFNMLAEEAKEVVRPSRLCANDDDDEP
ncbi:hypothetical protein C8K11_11371 [Novosphingobium sp. GV055]|nr:hypothetical protein [Novosphingobium capsulatum]PTR07860.1 hypothetical protein C8K11_11371 [Novosphingobium sp. GV055]PUB00673.1 hypothetical protein C8K12_11371 [Novosphingobium sp. GV061]PUB16082.1 hypothetical protein C8K14_11371 [Novosphingobium sp. GV079]PUB39547.1 hypothetical protein C8K10_11371 [Novosphingobium sp. GV027]WQD93784.1 hypothetical protein U0041_04075 [Novosphingobium capsulatum]